ncbi:beta-galactosidase small subunit [Bacteroides uniformis]|nr:beta-galactosidase small subunit [Bacteroides uniformis]
MTFVVRNGYNERLSAWKNAEQKRIVKAYQATVNDGMVIVDASLSLPPDRSRLPSPLHCGRQRPHTSRSNLSALEKEDIPLMPKFGMRMRMPSALNRIAWYGRGKFENYPRPQERCFPGSLRVWHTRIYHELHRTARQCQPVRYTLVHAGRQ